MEVLIEKKKVTDVACDVLIAGLFEEELSASLKEIGEKTDNIVSFVNKDFKGELKSRRSFPTNGKIPAKVVLMVGLGKKAEATLETLRNAAALALKAARDIYTGRIIVSALHDVDLPNYSVDERAQVTVEGFVLGEYRFDKYKTVDIDKQKIVDKLIVLNASDVAVNKGKVISGSTCLARDLINEPASNLTPEQLANEAKKLEKFGVKVTVFDKKEIEKLGLHALLAVNRGSVNEPRFVIMEYDGGGKKKVALVGKGITFDSGGLDIKNADGMLTMKCDMGGAAAIIATINCIAKLRLPVHVVGVFASTENMPGENAYKPGDVISSYLGKTIEIGNTDAEGRVVLSDALAYTEKKLKPDCIIDLATLTGACSIALGRVCAGVMGTSSDAISKLKESGLATNERVWEFPFYKEYHEMVKSDIADVYNMGKYAREAGTIMGGCFLAAFVEKTPWVHMDIANVDWDESPTDYNVKGGTGFGVRLLTHFLENLN